MSIKLEKGQAIEILVYKGSSAIEAETVYNHLNDHWKIIKPVKLEGSDFEILITKVEPINFPCIVFAELTYEIYLRGILV